MDTIQVLPSEFHTALYEVTHPRDPQTGKRSLRSPLRKGPLPVLTHVLIGTSEGRLACYTHDLDTPLVYYSPARIEAPFETCVPALPLLAWMDIIKDDAYAITLQHDPNTQTLHIYAGNAHAAFKCLHSREFPPVTKATLSGTAPDPVTITTALACRKDSAPEYASLHHVGGLLAGTDGHRLHTSPSTGPDEESPLANHIMEVLTQCANPTYTVITTGAKLQQAVKSLASLAKKENGWILFHCNGEITVTAENEELGASSASVDILNSTGGDVTFSLRYQHILDALAHVNPKQKREKGRPAPEPRAVTIQFTSWDAPIIITAEDRSAYIMPKAIIPADFPKPTKSELMTAYNRKRAELRRLGLSTYDLNRAFGILQSKAWTRDPGEVWHLVRAIYATRVLSQPVPVPSSITVDA